MLKGCADVVIFDVAVWFFFCLLQSANWVADADCFDVALLRLRIVDVKLLYSFDRCFCCCIGKHILIFLTNVFEEEERNNQQ